MAGGPRFSPEVNARIYEAHDLAARRGETHSDAAHLLVALLTPSSGEATQELDRRGHDVEALRALALEALPERPKASAHSAFRSGGDEAIQVTGGFMRVLEEAGALAAAVGDRDVDELHVLRSLLAYDDPGIKRALATVDLVSADSRDLARPRALSKLSRYGRILTDEAATGRLDPMIGRAAELERLIHILGRRRKNNPVLLGEPGVGKTAIVEGLAQAIVDGQVPSSIAGRHIFSLDVGSLVAGTKYRGEFESRIQELLELIRSSDGGIILFIDEVHLIARAGGAEGAIDAAGFLKPMLARGEIRAIGATTVSDYRRQVVGDGALERRFQPIHVRQPTVSEALEMLRGLRPRYEAHHGLTITDAALEAAVTEGLRIIHRNLPDKAIDLIDEASSRKRAMAEMHPDRMDGSRHSLEVTASDVRAILESWVGDSGQDWARHVYGQPGEGRHHG